MDASQDARMQHTQPEPAPQQECSESPRRYKTKQVTSDQKRLLSLAAIGEDESHGFCIDDHLSKSEITELDDYVRQETARIRAGWSAEVEADRRGVTVNKQTKSSLFVHDGRYFPKTGGAVHIHTDRATRILARLVSVFESGSVID